MESDNFDVIVVGAGIGGLVVGTYLARGGMKVLLVEKGEKVGGYCGSFMKDGFTFDEAVHYVNNFGPKGFLKEICDDLDVSKYIDVITVDPSDVLYMPGLEMAIFHDTEKTIEALRGSFPNETDALRRFFSVVANFKLTSELMEYRNATFQEFLDETFKSARLKTVLGLFATTMGLAPRALSALAGLAYYRGSILDGGHHFKGGAQTLSDALRRRFEECGGKLLLRAGVRHILVTGGRVAGIELENGSRFSSSSVISNCDATSTYCRLVGADNLPAGFAERIRGLRPSLSTMVVYLGVSRSLKGAVRDACNLWWFPYENIDAGEIDIVKDDRPAGYVHIGLSSLHDRSMAPEGCESLVLFSGASYMSKEYWDKNKSRLTDVLVARACRAIPALQGNIQIAFSATPLTLQRYTGNRDGAYRGWEIVPKQTHFGLVSEESPISGLFLTGHWITTPAGNGGVSSVAQHGRYLARRLLRSHKRSASKTAS